MSEFKVRFSREELSEAFDGFNAVREVIPTKLLYSYSRVRAVLDKLDYFAGPGPMELSREDACGVLCRGGEELEGLCGDAIWRRGELVGVLRSTYLVNTGGETYSCSKVRTVEGA